MFEHLKEKINQFEGNNENKFILELIKIENNQKKGIGTSPFELREEHGFEFKIWLQEMYEEMMWGKRSPVIFSKSLSEEAEATSEYRDDIILKLKDSLKLFFKIAYQNKPATKGLLGKLYIINEELPHLFRYKKYQKKKDTLLLKISYIKLVSTPNIFLTNNGISNVEKILLK